MPSIAKLESIINEFVSSKSSFKLLNDLPITNINTKGPLCILDSSFNPPQKAHYIIAKNALEYYSNQSPSILLLLATNNADKKGQTVQQFAHRVKMMQLMAESISTEANVYIGLTSHAKFIDKLHSVQTVMSNPQSPIVFLVGFDTLIRILDKKYYDSSIPLEQSLNPLMTKAKFFCVARHPDPISIPQSNSYSNLNISEQLNLSNQIRSNALPDVPSSWADQIIIIESTTGSPEGISSSLVRQLSQENQDITNYVLPSIASYLANNKIY